MQTIVVVPHRQPLLRAHLDANPACHGYGTSTDAAVGSLVRDNFMELDLDDRDLQVSLGHHWEEMADSEIGQVVQERGLFTIKVISSACN